jgi:hypothetical protein
VRLRVADVELERFRERANRVPDLLLTELTVTQGVPSPRGRWPLLHVRGEQQFDVGELALANVAFELGDACGVICGSGRGRSGQGVWALPRQGVEALPRGRCSGIDPDRFPVGGHRSLDVATLLERRAECVLRLR